MVQSVSVLVTIPTLIHQSLDTVWHVMTLHTYFLSGCYAGENREDKIRRQIKHLQKPTASASTLTCGSTVWADCLPPLLPKKAKDNLAMTRRGATVATAKADSHT